MGLERLACIMQGVDNIFEVDTVQNIMKKISEISGAKPYLPFVALKYSLLQGIATAVARTFKNPSSADLRLISSV